MVKDLFHVTPKVFRNTEAIYDNRIAKKVADMGYKSDTEVAIKSVRDKRFAKSKGKFEKELEETKKLIEAKKKEKVRLQNEIENTKKDKK